MSTRTSSKNNVIAQIQQLIAGLQKHLAGQTIIVGGTSIVVSDLIAELTAYMAQLNSVTAARGTWLQAVQATRTLESAQIDPLRAALSAYLEGTYGPSAAILTDFGLKPRKKPDRTAKSKAEAVEKNLATRAARGTKGARQKASIHGAVPPEPSPAPAPAPTGNAPAVVRPGEK